MILSFIRNGNVGAQLAGEAESRNVALLGVWQYRPSVLARSPWIVRKSQRMRMGRSATPALEAKSATVKGPLPSALKIPSSTPALSAALRWCAVIVSQMRVGFGSDIPRIISGLKPFEVR